MMVLLKASDMELKSRGTCGHAGTICHLPSVMSTCVEAYPELESLLGHVPNLKVGGGTE